MPYAHQQLLTIYTISIPAELGPMSSNPDVPAPCASPPSPTTDPLHGCTLTGVPAGSDGGYAGL